MPDAHLRHAQRLVVRRVAGGVAAPEGFLAAGIHAGIKKGRGLDLALLVTQRQGTIAGVFTKNRVVAASVLLDRQHLRGGIAHAVIINSGNANACTGLRGLADAKAVAKAVADRLSVPVETVFVGSTGVIGQPLPLNRIKTCVPALLSRLRRQGGREAAKAILTTDLRPKEVALKAAIGGLTFTIGGMAKGSGMIHPNMATMLAYLTTDAAVEQAALQRALRRAVDCSFNRISVDGDTSTNDTVLLIANGLAGTPVLREGSRAWPGFQQVLNEACMDLARHVCRDGEGVTKVVEVVIEGAKSARDAARAATAVATSCLVKTAIFGGDANWGRIMAAIGRSGARIAPERIDLTLGDVGIVRKGVGLGADAERRVARVVRRKEFSIIANLHQGNAVARMWTTDLSYEYVRINASYRS